MMLREAFQALRTTPLRLMVLTQALSIAALFSVLMTADRYQQLFSQEAAQLLGADVVLNSDREPAESWVIEAHSLGLNTAQTVLFSSVATSVDQQTLVSVKAVSDLYPLRGKMGFIAGGISPGAPADGTVWMDQSGLIALNLGIGQTVHLGQREFKISGIIEKEPDRGMQFSSFAPRLMLNKKDLASTQLLGLGSRATYRWLFSGAPNQIALFKKQALTQLLAGQRLETLDEGRPEMRLTLDRATKFLALVAILTTLIAACGLGLVAQVWAKEQTQWVAVMRTLGASTWDVGQRVAHMVGLCSVFGLVLGVALGYGLQAILASYLVFQEGVSLPAAGATPLLQAVCLLMLLIVACIAPAMQVLLRTKPIAIFRPSESGHVANQPWVFYALSLACGIALLMWIAGSVYLGGVVAATLGLVMVLLSACVWGFMRLALRVGRGHSMWLVRTASRGLLRNPKLSLIQASTLTVALLGVLTLGLLQKDVLGAWQNALPKDAPNHFILNIQPDQIAALSAALHAQGYSNAALLPMIRARLVGVNGKGIGPENYPAERAKRLVDREFNMSYLAELPKGNTVTQGVWQGNEPMALSMEEGIMETLGLKLGDALRFDVAGQVVDLKIGSVRKLRWESLNVNFFAITSATSAQKLPQTYITALRVEKNQHLNALIKQFPNLTIIDAGQVAQQAQSVLDKVTKALQLLFALAMVAGVLVVAVGAYASRVLRLKDATLLRVLGASKGQVRAAQLLEQWGLGAIAGFVAGGVALALVAFLTLQMLELPVVFGVWSIYFGVILGSLLSVAGALSSSLASGGKGLAQRLRGLSVL